MVTAGMPWSPLPWPSAVLEVFGLRVTDVVAARGVATGDGLRFADVRSVAVVLGDPDADLARDVAAALELGRHVVVQGAAAVPHRALPWQGGAVAQRAEAALWAAVVGVGAVGDVGAAWCAAGDGEHDLGPAVRLVNTRAGGRGGRGTHRGGSPCRAGCQRG